MEILDVAKADFEETWDGEPWKKEEAQTTFLRGFLRGMRYVLNQFDKKRESREEAKDVD